eukprot:1160201-Pelagomonas_calceolata.AAC.3
MDKLPVERHVRMPGMLTDKAKLPKRAACRLALGGFEVPGKLYKKLGTLAASLIYAQAPVHDSFCLTYFAWPTTCSFLQTKEVLAEATLQWAAGKDHAADRKHVLDMGSGQRPCSRQRLLKYKQQTGATTHSLQKEDYSIFDGKQRRSIFGRKYQPLSF